MTSQPELRRISCLVGLQYGLDAELYVEPMLSGCCLSAAVL